MVAVRPIASFSLSQSLKQYRTDQAFIRAIPPSTVFSDKLLSNIVKSKPKTLKSLLDLHGIGAIRCQNYGKDIVRLVNLDSKNKAKIAKKLAGNKPKALKVLKNNEKRGRGKGKSKVTNKKFEVKIHGVRQAKSRIKLTAPEKGKSKTRPPTSFGKPENVSLQRSLSAQLIPKRFPPSFKTSVYVLELEDGRVYVGSSKDVPRRLAQHKAGSGSAYTRLYRPTGVQLPRLGNVEGDGDAAERDETLRYMMLRGIPYVRGWKFSRVDMPPEEFDEAEANIRELFNLCRRCGYEGHFCTRCVATYDRLGQSLT